MSNTPLRRTFVTGLIWTSGAKWLTQGFTWASVFYGARLLSPGDFGMVEMAGFVAIIAQVIAEFGLGGAVMQMRHLGEREQGQLNSVSLLMGCLATLLSCAAAPWVADFFQQPALVELVRWNSLGFIVMSLQAVPQGLLQKDLDYQRLSVVEAAQAIVQAVLLVVCARAGYHYWSFVVSAITARVVATGLAWYWRPVGLYWPRWENISKAMQFGLNVSTARLSGSLLLLSDGFVIGRVIGNSPLGVYRMAINLASAPAEKVAQLVMRVTGPLFARLQEDHQQLGRYFFALSDVLTIVLAPMTVGFLVTTPELVSCLLGPQWGDAVGPARWLALYMSIRSLCTLGQQILVALGETRYFLNMSILSFLILPVCFYVGAQYGLVWVAAGWALTSPILLLPQQWRALRLLGCSVREYVVLLLPSTGSAVAMGIVVWFVGGSLGPGWSQWGKLSVEVTLGSAIYMSLLWAFQRDRINGYIKIIKAK